MKKKHTSTIWGIILIGVAVILVLSQLGLLGNIKVGLWTLLLTALFVITLIQGIFHISFSGILFSIAFLYIIYDDYLGITALTPWTVLVVALLGSIGLSMIFPPKKTWIVTSQVDVMLAGITEKNPKMHVGGGSKLLLTGDLKFAGIEITYI